MKRIQELLKLSVYMFMYLGVFSLGLKYNINKWVIVVFGSIYFIVISYKFKLVEEDHN